MLTYLSLSLLGKWHRSKSTSECPWYLTLCFFKCPWNNSLSGLKEQNQTKQKETMASSTYSTVNREKRGYCSEFRRCHYLPGSVQFLLLQSPVSSEVRVSFTCSNLLPNIHRRFFPKRSVKWSSRKKNNNHTSQRVKLAITSAGCQVPQ